mgnify:CR=1 FL=1
MVAPPTSHRSPQPQAPAAAHATPLSLHLVASAHVMVAHSVGHFFPSPHESWSANAALLAHLDGAVRSAFLLHAEKASAPSNIESMSVAFDTSHLLTSELKALAW